MALPHMYVCESVIIIIIIDAHLSRSAKGPEMNSDYGSSTFLDFQAVDVFSVQETGQSLAAAIGLVFGIDQDTGPCTCEMGSHCVMDRRIGQVHLSRTHLGIS